MIYMRGAVMSLRVGGFLDKVERLITQVNGRLNRRLAMAIPVTVFLLIILGEFLLILHLNSGVFTYTLDDAYIHLGLAENIARGHYGINMSEYSAPSSSILWPFLLAVFAKAPFFVYVPLLINIFSSAATVLLVTKFLFRTLGQFQRYGAVWSVMTGLLLIVAFNQVGLVFTGMEHSLQVLCAVLIVTGVITYLEEQHCSWWLPVLLFVAPLIRYEMLALSLPSLWLLWNGGKSRTVIGVLLCLASAMGGFAFFLHTHGLGWFPSSIVAKSEIVSGANPVLRIIHNFATGVAEKRGRGVFSLLLLTVFAGMYLNARNPGFVRKLSGWIGIAILLHFCFGQFGTFSRYEIYVWSSAVLCLLTVMTKVCSQILKTSASYKPLLLTLLFCCTTSLAYMYATIMTPVAANNIYEQQYQTHRFVAEFYRQPVAINDIGLPSFASDAYILDIWGLASRQALDFRKSEASPEWMNDLAVKNGVELALIYDTEYKPKNWVHLADWTISRRRITPSWVTVSVFSLCPRKKDEQVLILEKFRRTLPSGVQWNWVVPEG